MKFVLKQEKLEDMLEKLMVKDILPKSVLVAKGKTIQSVQKETHSRAFRFLKIKEKYFESIDEVEDEESIEFDAKKVIGLVKTIPSNLDVTWETKGNKIEISSDCRKFGVAIIEPEVVEKKLPFEMKDGIPTWDEESLDTNLKIVRKKEDEDKNIIETNIKEVTQHISQLSTDFSTFNLDNGELRIRTGEVTDFAEFAEILVSNVEVVTGDKLNVTFTYAIPQIIDTFRQDIEIWAKTDMPAWFYEKTNEYFLGVLVPPYTEEE